MINKPDVRYTPEEYLTIEREAVYKSEFFNGEIFAMSGASRKHNLITGNVYSSIHMQLRKRECEVYTNAYHSYRLHTLFFATACG